MNFRSAYNYPKAELRQYRQILSGETMTQKSDARDADINFIMKKYQKTGLVPVTQRVARSGDFTSAPDFREACERINEANEAFRELPAKIRKQFGNDPAEFLDFVHNPENLEEMRRMGLAKPAPMPDPAPAPTPKE